MKRRIAFLTILMSAVILLNGAMISSAQSSVVPSNPSQEQSWHVLDDGALEARLTHMLNRNYVFDDDFESDQALAENAIFGLHEKIEDGYIKADLLEAFIEQMYGKKVDVQLANYDGYDPKDGYIAVRPQGFTLFEHRITSILEDTDEGLWVTSQVAIYAHDGEPLYLTAVSKFVVANDSNFGYHLVACHINEAAEFQL